MQEPLAGQGGRVAGFHESRVNLIWATVPGSVLLQGFLDLGYVPSQYRPVGWGQDQDSDGAGPVILCWSTRTWSVVMRMSNLWSSAAFSRSPLFRVSHPRYSAVLTSWPVSWCRSAWGTPWSKTILTLCGPL